MKKVELRDAKPYAPPKHFNMTALRLHGKEETGTQQFWMGLSHFLPNGGAEMDATPAENSICARGRGHSRRSGQADIRPESLGFSVRRANEARAIINNTNMPASMLVIITYK